MVIPESKFCKRFSLYGAEIMVESYLTLDWLQNDFAYFFENPSPNLIGAQNTPPLTLKIRPLREAEPPKATVRLKFKECQVKGRGLDTWLVYGGEAFLHLGPHPTLFVDQADLAQELCYLFIMSRLGEIWDSRGFYRVHALSFLLDGHGTLVLAPSGGGKSSLALALSTLDGVTLLGDDICLVDFKGQMWPLPMRLSFRPDTRLPAHMEAEAQLWQRRKYGPKKLLPFKAINSGLLTDKKIVCYFLVKAEKSSSAKKPFLNSKAPLNLGKSLFIEMVIGVGLPQVAELILSQGLPHTLSLSLVALKRFLVACALLGRSKSFVLKMNTEPQECALVLVDRLRAHLHDESVPLTIEG